MAIVQLLRRPDTYRVKVMTSSPNNFVNCGRLVAECKDCLEEIILFDQHDVLPIKLPLDRPFVLELKVYLTMNIYLLIVLAENNQLPRSSTAFSIRYALSLVELSLLSPRNTFCVHNNLLHKTIAIKIYSTTKSEFSKIMVINPTQFWLRSVHTVKWSLLFFP